jgi:hypothetical protein
MLSHSQRAARGSQAFSAREDEDVYEYERFEPLDTPRTAAAIPTELISEDKQPYIQSAEAYLGVGTYASPSLSYIIPKYMEVDTTALPALGLHGHIKTRASYTEREEYDSREFLFFLFGALVEQQQITTSILLWRSNGEE